MKCQSKDRLPSLQGYAFTIIQKPLLCGSDQKQIIRLRAHPRHL